MKTLSSFLLIFLILGTANIQANELLCLGSGFQLYHDSYCLKYYSLSYRWWKADNFCNNRGYTMFYPENEEQYESAFTELQSNFASNSWLGVVRYYVWWKNYKVSYGTSDGKNFKNIWSGTTNLIDNGHPTGMTGTLEIFYQSGSPSFQYQSSYTSKRPFICHQRACLFCCDRICDLIDAFESLLPP